MSRFTRPAGVGSIGRSFEACRRRRRLAEWARRKSPWRPGVTMPPTHRYFRQSLILRWPQITRMPSAKDRTRKPNRVPAVLASSRAPRPPRRKVKAHSLFPLLRWLSARRARAPLHSDTPRLDASSHNNATPYPYGTRRRHNCCRSRDVYVWLPRERWLWCLFNGVTLFAHRADMH